MRVAALRDRLLAALVDAAVVILGIALVVGLGVGAAVAYARVRRGDDEDETDQDGDDDEEDVPFRGGGDALDEQEDRSHGIQDRIEELLQSRLGSAALWSAGAGLAVAYRNWRSPGFRVLGLRRVDASTGGPVSIRSVMIGMLFDQARQAATKPLFGSRAERQRDRMAELQPKLKEIEQTYATDRQARHRAVMEFYEANEVKPFAGCGWQVAGPILSQLVLAITIRNRRTIYDRVTGTIVIRDR